MTNSADIHFMSHALKLAKHAQNINEVPVGSVLVLDNKIIAEGFNCPISTQDPTAHAEIMALRVGAKHLNNYRLLNTTLYVTLEPCLMCIGAMIHARISRLVFGAADSKIGAVIPRNTQSVRRGNLAEIATPASQARNDKIRLLNHSIDCSGGVLQEECAEVLQAFFQARR